MESVYDIFLPHWFVRWKIQSSVQKLSYSYRKIEEFEQEPNVGGSLYMVITCEIEVYPRNNKKKTQEENVGKKDVGCFIFENQFVAEQGK